MCLVAQKMSGDPRSQGDRSNMVFGWSTYCRKSRVWYGIVCKHWSRCQARHFPVCSPPSLLYHTLTYLHSDMTTRLLIYNCTSGRLGKEFLATILNTVDVQLRHQSIDYSPKDFFDHVKFCTNMTYVDGGEFKPGQ